MRRLRARMSVEDNMDEVIDRALAEPQCVKALLGNPLSGGKDDGERDQFR